MAGEELVAHLRRLGDEVAEFGLRARVCAERNGWPYLRVVNPEAETMAENVSCATGAYVWSWGDRIGPVGNPRRVALVIARVLAVREDAPG
ncbi:hypothetical protein [Bailinhaonella thermotolerans]|nr:hypothetical protein [Bailinhaonella thermotolerans]